MTAQEAAESSSGVVPMTDTGWVVSSSFRLINAGGVNWKATIDRYSEHSWRWIVERDADCEFAAEGREPSEAEAQAAAYHAIAKEIGH